MGSYLRTNYRITGKELDITAIGGGVPLSSWAGGAGTRREFGGLVMGSVNAVDSVFSLPATQVMASFYGATIASAMNSGYKFVPIGFQIRYVVGSVTAPHPAGIWATLDDSAAMVLIGGSDVSQVTSSISAHFIYAGFIVSGP